MVAECSGRVFEGSTLKDPRSHWNGFLMGKSSTKTPNGKGSYGKGNEARCWNCTTINQKVNDRNYVGSRENHDRCNKPIISEHPGGAHLLFTDASVHLVMEDMDYDNLLNLANRDDGQVVELP
jgi:hypothetical protein